jgi:hypothetical protein
MIKRQRKSHQLDWQSWVALSPEFSHDLPYDERWTKLSTCSLDQIGTGVLRSLYADLEVDSSDDGNADDGNADDGNADSVSVHVRASFISELERRWPLYTQYARGRQLLRLVVIALENNSMSSERMRLSIDLVKQNHIYKDTREIAPDIIYALQHGYNNTNDLPLLFEIEDLFHRFTCRKTAPRETIIADVLTYALDINFFRQVVPLSTAWSLHYQTHYRENVTWAIPPVAIIDQHPWYVGLTLFGTRLRWLCPFVESFFTHRGFLRHGGVISGGIIPLCLLQPQVRASTQHDFMTYAKEVYHRYSIDIFFVCSIDSLGTVEEGCAQMIRDVSRYDSWKCRRVEWAEDDDTWAVRNRRGITLYFSCDRDVYPFEIQCIIIPNTTIPFAITHQHLPCVRAWYDGVHIHCTASAFTSWLTHFVDAPPLFGALVTPQRKAKTVLKYAMRGWGFSVRAVEGMKFPATIYQWISEYNPPAPHGDVRNRLPQRALPWYHPLYNRNLWAKKLEAEQIRQLVECVDV